MIFFNPGFLCKKTDKNHNFDKKFIGFFLIFSNIYLFLGLFIKIHKKFTKNSFNAYFKI